MIETTASREVFLHPGDFWFGDRVTRVRTLLGSCVAITLWHPHALIGGMCHYMMPGRFDGDVPADAPLDGRYADDAVHLFLHEIRSAGTQPYDYEVKMFGGGSQFVDLSPGPHSRLPDRNIRAGLDLLRRHGLHPRATHLGGVGSRQVILDVGTGDVWLRHVEHGVATTGATVPRQGAL